MSGQAEREFLIHKLESEIAMQEANLAGLKRSLADLKIRGTGRTTSLVKDIANPHTLFLVHNRVMIDIVADMAQEYLPNEVFETLQILNICDEDDMIAEHILQSRPHTYPIIVDHGVWEFALGKRSRLLPIIKYFQGIANKGRAE